MNAVQLLPALRDLFSKYPECRCLEPWELQSALFVLSDTDELADEADADVSGGKTPRKSPISGYRSGHNAQEVHRNAREFEPRVGNRKTMSDMSDVSEEQQTQIDRMVSERWAPHIAREEVLGNGWVEP
jgi:hypothetical protein